MTLMSTDLPTSPDCTRTVPASHYEDLLRRHEALRERLGALHALLEQVRPYVAYHVVERLPDGPRERLPTLGDDRIPVIPRGRLLEKIDEALTAAGIGDDQWDKWVTTP
jgi:hypothetical protein